MRIPISLFTIALSCVLSQAASINWTNHVANIQAETNGYFGTSVNVGAGFADARIYPDSGPAVTPFRLQSTALRLAGNIFEVSNGPGFLILSLDYTGLLSAPDLLLTGDASVQGAVLTDHVVATNGVVTGGLTNTSVSQLQGAVTANQITSTNSATFQAGFTSDSGIITNTLAVQGTANVNKTLVVGTGGMSNSVDSVVLISRIVTNDIAGNAHAFSDSSLVERPGGVAYNSFDARIYLESTNDYDHYAGFQCGPRLATSGHVTNLYGFYAGPGVTGGNLHNSYGAYFANPVVAGAVLSNNYGIYVASQTAGITTNYGIYVAGTVPSQFYDVFASRRIVVGNNGNVPSKQIEVQSANGADATIRVDQVGQNKWDFKSKASTTYLTLGDNYGDYLNLYYQGGLRITNTVDKISLEVDGYTGQTSEVQMWKVGSTVVASMYPSGSLELSGNLETTLSVGSTTYLDANFASQTNQVSGAMTFSYTTNGVHGRQRTCTRWLFNSSGSDQTLSFPIINTGVNGWRTNVFSPVPPAITNSTILKIIVDIGGPTDTLARQTNCYVKFEYYQ